MDVYFQRSSECVGFKTMRNAYGNDLSHLSAGKRKHQISIGHVIGQLVLSCKVYSRDIVFIRVRLRSWMDVGLEMEELVETFSRKLLRTVVAAVVYIYPQLTSAGFRHDGVENLENMLGKYRIEATVYMYYFLGGAGRCSRSTG